MKSNACTIGAFAFGCALAWGVSANAEGLSCKGADSVKCFIKLANEFSSAAWDCNFDIFVWQAKANTVYTINEQRALMGHEAMETPPRPDSHACVAKQKGEMGPIYTAAREHLAINKNGLAALKDAYAYWLTSVDMIPDGAYIVPTIGNINNYKRTMEDRERGNAERLNRLKLEM